MPSPRIAVDNDPVASPAGSDGGGGGNRLHQLEVDVARIDERVKSIRENMAVKNDITSLKVWILGGVLSAILVAAGIALAVVKLLPPA